ncbi:sulfatase family protein [Zunongwangia atlantica]|uniref:Sulfatase n=1 Tax=Zunongwangia atlantica 22II14-10F7 TaxID=1185767 RepID=A0A1Y1T2Q3_9FLAO|nr:arylsulfatase [Zunongwangia atlantica]ORL44763.1 sulfatase [Zunongwangia atlantica 22II14-10F7]
MNKLTVSKQNVLIVAVVIFLGFQKINAQSVNQGRKPNIVLIYIDDLGYGDIGVNGAKGLETPNIDKLAKDGINFTDAHSSAATCTPSRYSILTGSYAFRNKAEILEGDAPLIIDTEMKTLPDMLQSAGYYTGIVGKWHLGLGKGKVNWNQRVSPGPAEVGFNYSFLIPATGDRVPTVYLENQRVFNLNHSDSLLVDYKKPIPGGYPSGRDHPELLKQHTDNYHLSSITNGISRIGFMKGAREALWIDEEIPFVLNDKVEEFINENKDHPFFLFYSFHDIHQPRTPNIQFVESSDMGPRGDVIAQMDWSVGKVIELLEKQGILDNTLIIFTSDNGPILDDGYLDYAEELVGDHKPGGKFKGTKYSVFEAGTRVPTIVYWNDQIKPGTSDALLSQVDLYASIASLLNISLETEDAPDSEDHLSAWIGKKTIGRKYLLEEAYAYGLRMKNYKYIHPKEDISIPGWLQNKKIDPGFFEEPQLFDLSNDPSESKNIAEFHPDIVEKMKNELLKILNENVSK